ncbi:MAG: bis(5'-nucleosyl)-tetraphosphatase (symmetrical) YqeK [Sarcina sp.]
MLEVNLKNYLKENLSDKRYKHVLGVAETSVKLARLYGADEEKAKIAALAHDIAKELSIEKQKEILQTHNFEISYIDEASPQVLHSFVGSVLFAELFDFDDEEVLSAIDFHTTGRGDMSLLEKIIYIADYIEPTRNYPGVEELRKITFEDLDKGVLQGLNNTIKLVVDKNLVIHPLTIEARNYLLIELNNKDKLKG